MTGWSLRRWWRELWRSDGRTAPAGPFPAVRGGAGPGEADDAAPPPPPPRRRYTAAPAVDDPRREADLGAVLQALAGGELRRAELAARVGAGEWDPGRLDAVVAHGVASGVLVEAGDGAVRARYAD